MTHQSQYYKHLGEYSDWVKAASQRWTPPASPEAGVLDKVRAALGFFGGSQDLPEDPRVQQRWEHDGVLGEEVSWSVGYGPRTHAWVLKPRGADGPLPAILALHGHDGFKYYGKEKIADGPGEIPPVVKSLRSGHYEGRAFANELTREGFVVLIPDMFLWGSRRFPLKDMPELTRQFAEAEKDLAPADEIPGEVPEEVALYNAAAYHHEHLIEKYCRLLGTTLAGVVAFEDRVAASYVLSRDDVASEGGVGCMGLSGGGCRSALLQASCEHISAAIVVGMMSTYDNLLDRNVFGHTWMFFPDGWARYGDWPDLASCRAPSPLMVQYDRDDHLFTPEGMQSAHERIVDLYAEAGNLEEYEGRFYDGPHKFDLQMQEEAFDWLRDKLPVRKNS